MKMNVAKDSMKMYSKVAFMWLLIHVAQVTPMSALPTNFRSADVWSIVDSSSKAAPREPPREQLLHPDQSEPQHWPQEPNQTSNGQIKSPPRSKLVTALATGATALANFLHPDPIEPHMIPDQLGKTQVPGAPSGIQKQVSGAGELHMPEAPSGIQEPDSEIESTRKRNITGDTLVYRSSKEHPAEMNLSISSQSSISVGKIAVLICFGIILLGLLATFYFGDETSHEQLIVAKTPDEATKSVGLDKYGANTKANLLLLTSQTCRGTWANTYRNAEQGSKDALELLFRCNIIPVQEFAHSYVSQEHIDECVWISTQMLHERHVDEWVSEWPMARRTFEESVTACFAARTDAISNLYGTTPESSRGGLSPIVNNLEPLALASCPNFPSAPISREGSPPISPTSDPVVPNSPRSPRSDTGVMDCRTPGAPGAQLPLTPTPVQPSAAPQAGGTIARTYVRSVLRSNNSASNALAADQIPGSDPDLRNYVRANIPSAAADRSAEKTPPQNEEYNDLLRYSSGRSSVVNRCREIMNQRIVREQQEQAQAQLPSTMPVLDSRTVRFVSPRGPGQQQAAAALPSSNPCIRSAYDQSTEPQSSAEDLRSFTPPFAATFSPPDSPDDKFVVPKHLGVGGSSLNRAHASSSDDPFATSPPSLQCTPSLREKTPELPKSMPKSSGNRILLSSSEVTYGSPGV